MRAPALLVFLALVVLAGCQTGPTPTAGPGGGSTMSAAMTAWVDCVDAAYYRSRQAAGSSNAASQIAYASCGREEQVMAATVSAGTGVDSRTVIATYRARLTPQLVAKWG